MPEHRQAAHAPRTNLGIDGAVGGHVRVVVGDRYHTRWQVWIDDVRLVVVVVVQKLAPACRCVAPAGTMRMGALGIKKNGTAKEQT